MSYTVLAFFLRITCSHYLAFSHYFMFYVASFLDIQTSPCPPSQTPTPPWANKPCLAGCVLHTPTMPRAAMSHWREMDFPYQLSWLPYQSPTISVPSAPESIPMGGVQTSSEGETPVNITFTFPAFTVADTFIQSNLYFILFLYDWAI